MRKISITVTIIRFSIHRKYVHPAAILQTQFIQGLTRYPAYPFDAAGGRENAECQEEGFVIQGRSFELRVTSFEFCC